MAKRSASVKRSASTRKGGKRSASVKRSASTKRGGARKTRRSASRQASKA